ncbi:hypothetical protein AOLI_G00205940 [Acnodon oligacanthus]
MKPSTAASGHDLACVSTFVSGEPGAIALLGMLPPLLPLFHLPQPQGSSTTSQPTESEREPGTAHSELA